MKRYLPLWKYGWLGKIQWTSLAEKEDFYSYLNMEDNADTDYVHAKRVNKKIKN